MKFQNLFSSFVAVDQLENDLDNDAIVDFVYERRKDDSKFKWAGAYSSGHLPLDLLEKEPLKALVEQMDIRIRRVRDTIGIRNDVPHRIVNYWANIFEPTGANHIPAHPPHIHANYFLSVVYYPKAGERAGDLTLMSPFNAVEATMPFKHINEFSSWTASRWLVKPEPAKLVIFPSWVMHYVNTNLGDEDRISIAFNIALPHVDL